MSVLSDSFPFFPLSASRLPQTEPAFLKRSSTDPRPDGVRLAIGENKILIPGQPTPPSSQEISDVVYDPSPV